MSWNVGASSAASLGLRVASVEVGTGMIDNAVLETAANWTGSAPFSFGEWLTISADGTVVLYGMVTGVEPFASAGGAQGFRITVSGPWWHMERTPFTQPFFYATGDVEGETKARSRCWIGVDRETGEREDTKLALDAVLTAAEEAGIDITHDLSGMSGVLAPPFEVEDQTCASVALQLLRWHPGLYFFFRYGTGSAVLYVAASNGSVSVACGGSGSKAVSASVKSRDDMVPEGITIRWERVNSFEVTGDETSVVEKIEEHTESAGTAAPAVGVLMYTIDLAGSKTQYAEQAILTRTVPDDVAPEDGGEGLAEGTRNKVLKWYSHHVNWITALPSAALDVLEHTRVMNRPEWDSSDPQRPSEWSVDDALPGYDETADPGDLPRELLEGQVPEWATYLKAEPMLARVKLRWNGGGDPTTEQTDLARAIFGEALDQERTFDVNYTGTNASSRRYRGLVKFTAAEPWPTAGLAAGVLAALDSLRYEGTVTAAGITQFISAKPGMMLTLTGGGSGGAGVVQRVAYDGATRRTSIQFGFAGHLTVPDFIELQRASRKNPLTANYNPKRLTEGRAANEASAAQGSKRGRAANTQSPDGGGGGSRAFAGFMADATHFQFTTPGTLSGFHPTNMFDGDNLLRLSVTAPGWIVLRMESIDNEVQSSEIVYSETEPNPPAVTEGSAPGTHDIALYYITSAGKTHRMIGNGSLWATALEVRRTSAPAPEPCGDAVVRWYQWEVRQE